MSMSIGSAIMPPAPPPDPYSARQFSVDEYHQMIQSGILTEMDRVELLEGWIVRKMPRNPPHDGFMNLANRVIKRRLPSAWHIRIQCAITTLESEPEPDLAVVKGMEEAYLADHPTPTAIALIVEVSDTTLVRDRGVKARVYAHAGIPCYWIINLVDRHIEVYTVPSGPDAQPRYCSNVNYAASSSIPFVIDGQEYGPIPVGEIFPG